MKRFEICATARTTGMPLVYNVTDSAAEAFNLARQMKEQRVNGVQIHDAIADKFYTVEAFAAEHRL